MTCQTVRKQCRKPWWFQPVAASASWLIWAELTDRRGAFRQAGILSLSSHWSIRWISSWWRPQFSESGRQTCSSRYRCRPESDTAVLRGIFWRNRRVLTNGGAGWCKEAGKVMYSWKYSEFCVLSSSSVCSEGFCLWLLVDFFSCCQSSVSGMVGRKWGWFSVGRPEERIG